MIKDSKYVKLSRLNILYLIFNKVNLDFEEINGSKYSMLVPNNESKEIIKNMKNCKIRDLIRLITKNSDDYDDKHMKIKFNSNDELPLNKKV